MKVTFEAGIELIEAWYDGNKLEDSLRRLCVDASGMLATKKDKEVALKLIEAFKTATVD